MRHYRVDLLDWYRGELSTRRLAVLLRHLPTDSALARELHGEGADWGVTEYLLAAAVDHLALGNWMFSAVHRDEDAGMPEAPVPVPRPGVQSVAEAEPVAGGEAAQLPNPTELALFFR